MIEMKNISELKKLDEHVWVLSFIHVKPGMALAYEKYLAGDWKKEQEAL